MVWDSNDRKYVSDEIGQIFLIKADILLTTWNADMGNNVGCVTFPQKGGNLRGYICYEIFKMMNNIKLKAGESSLDKNL